MNGCIDESVNHRTEDWGIRKLGGVAAKNDNENQVVTLLPSSHFSDALFQFSRFTCHAPHSTARKTASSVTSAAMAPTVLAGTAWAPTESAKIVSPSNIV